MLADQLALTTSPITNFSLNELLLRVRLDLLPTTAPQAQYTLSVSTERQSRQLLYKQVRQANQVSLLESYLSILLRSLDKVDCA